jgi:hypothetical protein
VRTQVAILGALVKSHFLSDGLQAMQVVRSLLRVASGGEDRAVVVLQHLKAVCDKAGAILVRLKSKVDAPLGK